MVFMGSGIAFCLVALRHPENYINILIYAYALFLVGGFLEGAIPAFLFSGSLLIAATHAWINEKGGLNISIMAVAVGMYLSLKMTIPIFIGGMIKMYIDGKFDKPLRKTRPELYKKGEEKVLAEEKEKLHGPGILFASGLIAGEAIMGIGLAGMAVSGIYLGITEDPSVYPGLLAFTFGAMIMATFSLRQMKEDDFGKVEEWNYSEEVQEAEMVEEVPKKKARKP
jgi:hypothetical protein